MLRLITRLIACPILPRRAATKKVAILIPLSNRSDLTSDEQISLRHLYHHLGSYDRYFLAPKGVKVPFPEWEVKRFAPKYFGSVGAHTRFLYWPGLYEAFSDYEFVFFYHLDSLVFSDQLPKWMERDIDYIGPPWLNCADTPWIKRPRVGNCGFALLRTRAALDALYSRYQQRPGTYWLDLLTRNGKRLTKLWNLLERLSMRFPKSKLINRPLEEWRALENPGPANRNTDIFWSDHAVRFSSSFKVATFEEGLAFGFEVIPQTCFELNGRRMPFGCHAWPRYDRKFWEPHLLGDSDPTAEPSRTDTFVAVG